MEAQQPQYHYQYQTQIDTNPPSSSLSYDPSQVQAYDQSTQAYYGYPHHHYNQPQQQLPQQDYSSYFYPDYSTSYQTHNELHSIHPPGVPIQAETQQTLVQNPQNLYYPDGVVTYQAPPAQGYMPPVHSTYRGGGSQGGRSVRGGGRGTFGRHGKGRGGTHGKHVPPQTSAAAKGEAGQSSSKPPPQMAWCELCRVDCNTLEILEQHKNGKKHKKNLKVYEELQNLSKQLTVQNPQMPLSQSKPENVLSKKPEAPVGNQLPSENVTSELTVEAATAEATEEPARKDHFGGRGGLKRKMRGGRTGGRGGKWVRAHDGSRRPVEPPKPKQVVPLLCDLCNVKCESQVVFESHIAGKKHLSNVKRFQGHKEAFGEGIQALYPTLPSLPSTSIIPQTNQQGPQGQDAQALAAMMLNQHSLHLPDPQAAQAALTQLLNQHGIHDAQTLLTQLVPYLLAQFQVPGVLPVPEAGLGVETQNPQSQGPQVSTGTESQNVVTENKNEQQNMSTNAESQAGTRSDNAGAEQVIPVPAKEETAASEHEKQSK